MTIATTHGASSECELNIKICMRTKGSMHCQNICLKLSITCASRILTQLMWVWRFYSKTVAVISTSNLYITWIFNDIFQETNHKSPTPFTYPFQMEVLTELSWGQRQRGHLTLDKADSSRHQPYQNVAEIVSHYGRNHSNLIVFCIKNSSAGDLIII